ncbi:hypothetical protein [Capnocytophaga canis]|uniref:hypothetical protein n=1 Tax=Capnocytophaga canis TaxID=1848903 RepID=UPI001BB2F364|nr:hypothetical protein [Capnocytophaga canis]
MEQGLILPTPINEHDVFEALKECGFEYKLVSFQHITDDQELISYGYRWILWKKDLNSISKCNFLGSFFSLQKNVISLSNNQIRQ